MYYRRAFGPQEIVYLDGIPDFEGPALEAAQSGEVHVVNDITTAEEFPEARRDQALAHDHHALAAVPLMTEATTYGVLVVYAPTDHTITEDERAILGDLGQMVAQAIQRVHSQRALTAETVVTLDLRLPETELKVGEASARFDCELALEQWVTTSDGGAIYYLSVHDADPERICEFLRETLLDYDCTVVREAGDNHAALIECCFDDKPDLPSDILGKYGGSMTTAHFADGDLSLGVELPPTVDVRTVVDALREVAPTVELVSKQYVRPKQSTVDG